MPLSQFERSVVLFNLHIEMVPREAEVTRHMTMSETMRLVVDAMNGNRTLMRVSEHIDDDDPDGTSRGAVLRRAINRISIKRADWEDDDVLTLLFHHGDAAATDPALIRLGTGEVWTAGKQDSDGLAHAAHFSVQCAEDHKSKRGQWKALVERVPNLSRSNIIAYVNRILREESDIAKIEYRDESGRVKKCHPKLVAYSQMSHNLKADLQEGKLIGVEFITHTVEDGMDEDDVITPHSYTLSHKIIRSPPPSRVMEFVEQLREWGKRHDYETMQLHIHKSKDRRNISPRMATDLDDASDVVYSKLETIENFSERLGQCPDEIVKEIQTKMRHLFDVEENWR